MIDQSVYLVGCSASNFAGSALGLLTLEGRIRRGRQRGAPASKGRHLPSSLRPFTSFLTGLP
jgi:hypothetical protein